MAKGPDLKSGKAKAIWVRIPVPPPEYAIENCGEVAELA